MQSESERRRDIILDVMAPGEELTIRQIKNRITANGVLESLSKAFTIDVLRRHANTLIRDGKLKRIESYRKVTYKRVPATWNGLEL